MKTNSTVNQPESNKKSLPEEFNDEKIEESGVKADKSPRKKEENHWMQMQT